MGLAYDYQYRNFSNTLDTAMIAMITNDDDNDDYNT
jgi:hypothetical protein